MRGAILALTAVLSVSPAFGQQGSPRTQIQDEEDRQVRDLPLGSPYRTGDAYSVPNRGNTVEASVPLRDFLSKSIDGVRAEVLNRLDQQEQYFFRIINERDRQYLQRFDAAKEAVANALDAARVATDKAQEAADKRFDSVNEFRETLADQTREFIRRETFEASIGGLDARMLDLSRQLDTVMARDEGAASLWGYLVGGFGLIVAAVALMLNWSSRVSAASAVPTKSSGRAA